MTFKRLAHALIAAGSDVGGAMRSHPVILGDISARAENISWLNFTPMPAALTAAPVSTELTPPPPIAASVAAVPAPKRRLSTQLRASPASAVGEPPSDLVTRACSLANVDRLSNDFTPSGPNRIALARPGRLWMLLVRMAVEKSPLLFLPSESAKVAAMSAFSSGVACAMI